MDQYSEIRDLLKGCEFTLEFKAQNDSNDESSVLLSYVIIGLVNNDKVLCICEQHSCYVIYPIDVLVGKSLTQPSIKGA